MSENVTFEVGQVVKLKSGGLPMTVTGLKADSVSVVWCETDDKGNIRLRSSDWDAACLMLMPK